MGVFEHVEFVLQVVLLESTLTHVKHGQVHTLLLLLELEEFEELLVSNARLPCLDDSVIKGGQEGSNRIKLREL